MAGFLYLNERRRLEQMQEYGALLRNTFKNPFDDFNASLIDTDKIVRFWCDPTDKGPKELLSVPVFFTQKCHLLFRGLAALAKLCYLSTTPMMHKKLLQKNMAVLFHI